MKPWKLTGLLLCVVLMIGTGGGCVAPMPAPSPQDDVGEVLQPDAEQPYAEEQLQSALSTFREGYYVDAGRDFHAILRETDDPTIHRQAMLGATLADLLVARDLAQIDETLAKWNDFSREFDTADHPPEYFLLEPLMETIRHKKKQEEQFQSLITQLSVTIDQMRGYEEQVVELRKQVEELEDLFSLLEQKKRQLTE